MKILIFIESTNLGGHVISALTTGRELKKRGHEVHFAADNGKLKEEIQTEFKFYPIQYFRFQGFRESYFTLKSVRTIRQALSQINFGQYDHIHAFDARSYIVASIISTIKKIPVTCTLCGSLAPYYNIPKSKKIIVFSREQKEKMISSFGWKKQNIAVISTRLDMEQFSSVNVSEVDKLLSEFNVNTKEKNIMMITNFLPPKRGAILHVLEASKIFLPSCSETKLIFIGGRSNLLKEMAKIGEEINKKCGRQAVVFTDKVLNAYRLLVRSYIVLGVGRSAFEGMALKKPTLIVGVNGYAGTVSPKKLEELGYYNFSGRNLKGKKSPNELSDEIIKLVNDGEYYKSIKDSGTDFLRQKIDIKSGIGEIERVYNENDLFFKKNNFFFKTLNIMEILTPVLFDNYYNQLKLALFPSKRPYWAKWKSSS